jgi:hypothetical protein
MNNYRNINNMWNLYELNISFITLYDILEMMNEIFSILHRHTQ